MSKELYCPHDTCRVRTFVSVEWRTTVEGCPVCFTQGVPVVETQEIPTERLLKIKVEELEQLVQIHSDRVVELKDFLEFEKRQRSNDVAFWKSMYNFQKNHTEDIIDIHNQCFRAKE